MFHNVWMALLSFCCRRKCSQETWGKTIFGGKLFYVLSLLFMPRRMRHIILITGLFAGLNCWKKNLHTHNIKAAAKLSMHWDVLEICNTLIVLIFSDLTILEHVQLLYKRVECPKSDKNMRNETMKGAQKGGNDR